MIILGKYKIEYKNVQFFILGLYFLFLYMMNYTPPYQYFALLFMAMQFLVMISNKGQINFKVNAYIWFQVIFIAYILLHTILGFSEYKDTSITGIKTVIWNFAISFVIINFFESVEDIEKLMAIIIICVFLTDIFILVYTKGTGENGRLAHGAVRPIWHNAARYISMEFSNISVYATLFSVYFYTKTKKIIKLLPIALFGVVVIMSGSRKAIVFLCLSVFIFLFLSQNGNILKKTKILVSAVITVFIIGMLVINVPYLYNLVGYRFVGYVTGVTTGEFTETSANSRNNMKEVAIELIKKEPIKGHGIDTYRRFPGSYNTWSHNNYLELLVSCGIIIMPIYYWYHLYALGALWRIRKRNSIANVFIAMVICILIFDSISVTYMSRIDQPWLFLSAVLVSKINQSNEENQKCKAVFF